MGSTEMQTQAQPEVAYNCIISTLPLGLLSSKS